MPAFCPTCWKELPSGKDFCPVCGKRVTLGPYTGKYRPWSPFWLIILDGWNVYIILSAIFCVVILLLALLYLLWWFVL